MANETIHLCPNCQHEIVLDCSDEVHDETIRMMRTKRKAFVIATSTIAIFSIMWAMAQDFSKDDVIRGVLVSMVVGIGVWFGTSLKAEEKVRSGGGT